jgi:hypothetical protein
MVSIDHFRHELLAQLGRAATRGRIDVLINSGGFAAPFLAGVLRQLLAAMPCKLSSSWAIRWFSTGRTVQG